VATNISAERSSVLVPLTRLQGYPEDGIFTGHVGTLYQTSRLHFGRSYISQETLIPTYIPDFENILKIDTVCSLEMLVFI
jgi:hypothetical protein